MKKDKVSVSPPAKRRRKRWTRDDTELTRLGLPAVVWYALFCYLPMFGPVSYTHLAAAARGLSRGQARRPL